MASLIDASTGYDPLVDQGNDLLLRSSALADASTGYDLADFVSDDTLPPYHSLKDATEFDTGTGGGAKEKWGIIGE